MNKRGCNVTGTNVEKKWNSLLKSHKKITINQKGTEGGENDISTF